MRLGENEFSFVAEIWNWILETSTTPNYDLSEILLMVWNESW